MMGEGAFTCPKLFKGRRAAWLVIKITGIITFHWKNADPDCSSKAKTVTGRIGVVEESCYPSNQHLQEMTQ